MQINRFIRGAAASALGASASLAFVAPALAAPAADVIAINPGNVPATAADYEHECGDRLGGGPYPGKDVWVFNLPGNADRTGVFTSITAAFDTDGDGTGDETVVIEAGSADGDDIVTVGHSKAYAITTAGWTLIGATATITGRADKFVLTHTCAAAGAPSASPSGPAGGTPPPSAPVTPVASPSTSPSGSPSAGVATPTPTGTATDAGTPAPAGTPTESPSATPAPGADSDELALTGAAAGSIAVIGAGLVGGGILLTLRRRRRTFVA
jgi:LPXTG-motif cell wall-anchored protein